MTPPSWFEHLSPPHCRELLATHEVGRIGVLVDSAPEIYPVNYAFDGHSVIFKTGSGTKLRGVLRSPSVCFEIDGFDSQEETGWSVLVKGRAIELLTAEAQAKVLSLPLRIWAPGPKSHWIRIEPDSITGRRISHPPLHKERRATVRDLKGTFGPGGEDQSPVRRQGPFRTLQEGGSGRARAAKPTKARRQS